MGDVRLGYKVHQLEGRKKSVERVKSFVVPGSWSVLVERDLPWPVGERQRRLLRGFNKL